VTRNRTRRSPQDQDRDDHLPALVARLAAERDRALALAARLQQHLEALQHANEQLAAELAERPPKPGAHTGAASRDRLRHLKAQRWNAAHAAGEPLGTAWSPLPHIAEEPQP
jgi:hypothetical protein